MRASCRERFRPDETYIGGEPRNRHRNDPREQPRRYGTSDKFPVFALVHRESREVRSVAMPKVNGSNIWDVLESNTVPGSMYLRTDASPVYRGKVAGNVADHKFVDHSAGEYVGRGGVSTNLVEGFFSELKRAIRGTHIHVSVEHLHRYLAQFDFMYSNCKSTDSQRMRAILDHVAGRRLTYAPLVGQA